MNAPRAPGLGLKRWIMSWTVRASGSLNGCPATRGSVTVEILCRKVSIYVYSVRVTAGACGAAIRICILKIVRVTASRARGLKRCWEFGGRDRTLGFVAVNPTNEHTFRGPWPT